MWGFDGVWGFETRLLHRWLCNDTSFVVKYFSFLVHFLVCMIDNNCLEYLVPV